MISSARLREKLSPMSYGLLAQPVLEKLIKLLMNRKASLGFLAKTFNGLMGILVRKPPFWTISARKAWLSIGYCVS